MIDDDDNSLIGIAKWIDFVLCTSAGDDGNWTNKHNVCIGFKS